VLIILLFIKGLFTLAKCQRENVDDSDCSCTCLGSLGNRIMTCYYTYDSFYFFHNAQGLKAGIGTVAVANVLAMAFLKCKQIFEIIF
jgi:hypothetical protein